MPSGKNIYPEEIESHYLKSPYIKEICILETSSGLGALHAVISPNIDYFRKTKEVNIQAKIRWLLENLSKELPSYKRIMGFTIIKEELPRTRLGKLKRYEIKEKYLLAKHSEKIQGPRDLTQGAPAMPQPPLVKQVLEFLSRQLKLNVGLNDHLELDLGIDSLARVELSLGLEKVLDISIPETILAEAFTVNELILKLEGLLKNKGGRPYALLHQPSWSQIIKETPEASILNKINIKPRLVDMLITLFFTSLLRFLFRAFWGLRIKGQENIPQGRSAFLICPNHSSFLDGFIVASGVGIKTGLKLFFLGDSGYFKHPLVSWALKLARLIAIDPSVNLTDAMQSAGFVLRNNRTLCIFPEGQRSIDGDIKEFKKGVGILIKEMALLVLPCYIQGSFQSWPRGQTLPRPYPLKITFGRPLTSQELKEAGLAKHPTPDDYEAITLGLKEKVLELSS